MNIASISRKDQALERRFQPVMVDQPTVEDTISILRGIKDRYEVYHGVKITDSSLVAAATLSNRYITDRFLPDKAIDLVDEACAMIKTEMNSLPAELDEVQRKIMQMEIEEAALKKEDDRLSKERLEELMLDSTQLVKDVGTMLEGEDAVREGMIDEVGGISMALKKLREMIRQKKC